MTDDMPPADAIVQLTQRLHAFFGHLDERRYEPLVGMFLPEARWLRQGRWLEGRPAILAALHERPADMRVRHVASNVLVRGGQGDEATVDAYLTAFRQPAGGPPALFSLNTVATAFRRVDGRWMVAEQRMVREFEFPVA